MGCSSSKLAGDDFNDMDAAKPKQMTFKPSESATSTMTEEEHAHKDSHAYTGTLPFTSESTEPKQKEDKVPLIEGRSDSVTRYAYEVRARDVEIARTGGSNTGVSYAPTPSNP